MKRNPRCEFPYKHLTIYKKKTINRIVTPSVCVPETNVISLSVLNILRKGNTLTQVTFCILPLLDSHQMVVCGWGGSPSPPDINIFPLWATQAWQDLGSGNGSTPIHLSLSGWYSSQVWVVFFSEFISPPTQRQLGYIYMYVHMTEIALLSYLAWVEILYQEPAICFHLRRFF